MRIKALLRCSLAQLMLVPTLLIIVGCLGTEVGNGLKPKNDDDKKKQDRSNPPEGVANERGESTVDDGASASPDMVEPSSITGMMLILSNPCANPFGNADLADLELVDTRDPAATTVRRISVAAVGTSHWELSADNLKSIRVEPSADTPHRVVAKTIEDGTEVSGFSCSAVTVKPLSTIDGQPANAVEFSAKVSHPRLGEGENTPTLRWIGTVDGNGGETFIPFQLEQIEITDNDGKSLIKLFANY